MDLPGMSGGSRAGRSHTCPLAARRRTVRIPCSHTYSVLAHALSPHTTLHHAGCHARTDTARRWNRQCRAPRAVDGESFAATSTRLPPLSTYCSIDVPPPRPLRPLPPPHAPAHPPRTPCLAQPRSERVAAAALFRVCSIVSAPFVLSPSSSSSSSSSLSSSSPSSTWRRRRRCWRGPARSRR